MGKWESGMVAIEGDLQRLKGNRMDEEEGRSSQDQIVCLCVRYV